MSGIEFARQTLETQLTLFSTVATSTKISAISRRTILHHHAKALRNLRRFGEAQQTCESILREFDNAATKLLLARLLLTNDTNKDELRAVSLLLEILDEADANPDNAEISVVLASIETLGWWQISKASSKALPDALSRFRRLLAELIKSSAVRGFDQAFVAFAAIGRKLRYHDENTFFDILQSLPRHRPEDAADDNERKAWGAILLSASEGVGVANSDDFAKTALEFYEALRKPGDYDVQQKGHCLVRLGQYEKARDALLPLVADNPSPWSCFWLSKSFLALGECEEALKLIDSALGDPKAGSFQATFLEHRFEIRRKLGAADAINDLRRAYEACSDEKHKGSLFSKLAAISGQ